MKCYDCHIMLTELQDIGLSEKEAKVYMAALEIGRATAEQLAKHAKLVRPTTYLQIKSLMEKGLVSTYEEGKKTYFAPESPELLKRLLIKQKSDLDAKQGSLAALLPELLRQFESAGERPVVRFFPGKDGIAAVREEVLATKSKQTHILFSASDLFKLFSQAELDDYTNRREALGIHSKGIYTDKEVFDISVLNPLTERRGFPLNVLPLTIDIYIFDDKVGILSLKGFLFGLVIQSSEIASSIKTVFDFLWQQAKGA